MSKAADPLITLRTEKATNFSCILVVIHRKALDHFRGMMYVSFGITTDGAQVLLRCRHLIILFNRHSKGFLEIERTPIPLLDGKLRSPDPKTFLTF